MTHTIKMIRIQDLYIVGAIALLSFCTTFLSFAATDTIIVQTSVGGDLIPPSAPTGLIATPVATTQIDLSWDSASDNVAVAGYHVWRDAVQIATTSMTSYSDTGLSPSTAYTYYVTAFDISGNESSSLAPVTETTLDPIIPSESDTSTQGSQAVPFQSLIQGLQIIPQEDTALVLYETEGYIRATTRWGKTASYEEGWLREEPYRKQHNAYLTGLTPDTLYHIRIEGERPSGRSGVLYEGTFRTAARLDMLPPGNVWDLHAQAEGDDVVLSWKNPPDPDLGKIRVVRNAVFYPVDAVDGWVIYEGRGTEARDAGILAETGTVHYSVFVYDEEGNISSGAIIRYAQDTGETIVSIDPYKNSLGLSLDAVVLAQQGEDIPWMDSTVLVDASKPFLLRIPYGRLLEHLKTIVAVIRQGGVSHSVLLRINTERSAYEAVVSPLGRAGSYPLQISVIDYTALQVGYAEGTIAAYGPQQYGGPVTGGWRASVLFRSLVGIGLMMLLIATAYVLRKISRGM